MKPSKIRELLADASEGDFSGWEVCGERRADGMPHLRLDIGWGFRLGRVDDAVTVLYIDDGFSMIMEVQDLSSDGIMSGIGAEAVFSTVGGRKVHIEVDREELDRFTALALYRRPPEDGGSSFVMTDELGIYMDEPVDGPVTRFPCRVSYATKDGQVSVEASGEAVYTTEGPAVVGHGFRLSFPMDLLALSDFKNRVPFPQGDTGVYLRDHRGDAVPSFNVPGLGRALALLRPGSRAVRVPKVVDEGPEWDG